MKRILKLLSIVILLFSFTINVNAQTKHKHNKKERKEMIKALDLTKQQKEQLKSFHKSTTREKKAIKNNASLSKEQKKEKFMQLHNERQDQLQSILTPAQKEKMKEMRDNKPRRGVTNMPNERTAK